MREAQEAGVNRKNIVGSWILVIYIVFQAAVAADASEAGLAENKIQPLITTAELTVGENRFAFGLLKANTLVENADVLVRLYAIDRENAQFVADIKAPYQTVRSVTAKDVVHRHADGARHVHTDDTAVRGLYLAQLNFTHSGTWGVELLVRKNGVSFDPIRLSVTVFENSPTPAVGSPAPRSKNLVAKDVKNLREIDTSARPDPRLHQIRIADAIAQGKPQLIVFATPQFCTSRMCGPVIDVVRTLLPAFGKRVAFTHQEIWQDFASKKVFSTIDEWRLQSEPWIFLLDGQGIIRAKFEGLVTERELEVALQQVLALPSGGPS
jgi:hypothetical protein